MKKALKRLSRRRFNQILKKEFEDYERAANFSGKSDQEIKNTEIINNEIPASIQNKSKCLSNIVQPHHEKLISKDSNKKTADYVRGGCENTSSNLSMESIAISAERATPVSLLEQRKYANLSAEDFLSSDDRLILEQDSLTWPETSLADDLQMWVKSENVSMRTVNSLLHILRKHGHVSELPSDCRTLVQTPKKATKIIQTINGGLYAHFGVESSILKVLQKNFVSCPTTIKVLLNCDGISLSESSKDQMWPILLALEINGKRTKPFIVGAHYGSQKPLDANCFIEKCVLELKNVLQKGINFKGNLCVVKYKATVCDSPARTFLTYTKSHAGYYSCSKCIQEGIFFDHVILPEVDSPLRTDESFRLKLNSKHHTGTSLLEELDIGMVSQNVLDYMHLVCLGVVKRIIANLLKGPKSFRITTQSQKSLDEIMTKFKNCIPREFSRTLRPLKDYLKYKATEFRMFLLYIGPVVLKDNVKPEFYKHFLLLSMGIRILCDPTLCIELNDYANTLLISFVEQYKILYGLQGLTYNIHNLIHLCNEVKTMGSLDSFSCFPFENYLKNLKCKIKTAPKPLHQLVNRLYEEDSLPIQMQIPKVYPIIHRSRKLNITRIELENFSISPSPPNNCFFMSNGSVVMIDRINETNEKIFMGGKEIVESTALFYEPCDSRKFQIYVCEMSSAINVSNILIENIRKKFVRLPYGDKDSFVCIPLMHH